MRRKVLFLLFLYVFTVQSEIVEDVDASMRKEDSEAEKINVEEQTQPKKTGIAQTYVPQIFQPYDQKFLNAMLAAKQTIGDALNIDTEIIEIDQIKPKFQELKLRFTESLEKLYQSSKQIRLKMDKIFQDEQENGSILLQDLNTEVMLKVNSLVECVEVFHQRMETLLQLSEDRLSKGRGNQLQPLFQMYFSTFQEESNEFHDCYSSIIRKLDELKEKSSAEFYFDDPENDFLTNKEKEERRGGGGSGGSVTSAGLEELYLDNDNNQEEL